MQYLLSLMSTKMHFVLMMPVFGQSLSQIGCRAYIRCSFRHYRDSGNAVKYMIYREAKLVEHYCIALLCGKQFYIGIKHLCAIAFS